MVQGFLTIEIKSLRNLRLNKSFYESESLKMFKLKYQVVNNTIFMNISWNNIEIIDSNFYGWRTRGRGTQLFRED